MSVDLLKLIAMKLDGVLLLEMTSREREIADLLYSQSYGFYRQGAFIATI